MTKSGNDFFGRIAKNRLIVAHERRLRKTFSLYRSLNGKNSFARLYDMPVREAQQAQAAYPHHNHSEAQQGLERFRW